MDNNININININTELWQYIFKFLDSPLELLKLAKVSKYFYGIARCNTVWYPLKTTLLQRIPVLKPLFDRFENHNTYSDTKTIRPRPKKKRRNVEDLTWVTPKGIWFVYAKHLSATTLSQVLRRKSSRNEMLDAICYAFFIIENKNKNNKNIEIENRSHPLLGEYRFQRCIDLGYHKYVWLCTKKYSKNILLFREDGVLMDRYNAEEIIKVLHSIVFYYLVSIKLNLCVYVVPRIGVCLVF